jgi:pyruvate/2-oxoglutarate dehydrogenase complex dihydrolipoamide acyltransferase (E2) component|tara:strand:+ start:131 stop:757 length:627 start_codon:yes stop_codon:yes gene_type:complete
MATSAQTLSLIIDELVKAKPLDRDAAVTLLSAKGYLPKKLTEAPKEKKASRFASKAAEDYAEAKSMVIPDGFKGTAANDKISVKDIKQLAEGPKKVKVNASPSAQQFARDNGLDITTVKGSGAEGKVLLKDIKDLKPTAKAAEEPAKRKVSSSAAKLMKQYEIDEEDIVDIEGSGKEGTVVAKDLKELIDMIKAEKSGDSSDDSPDED